MPETTETVTNTVDCVQMATMALSFHSFIILVLSLLTNLGSSERIKDKMYQSLDGAFCFRILSASGQFGCTTSFSGDTGVVHFVDGPMDVDWIVSNGDAGPYIPVVELSNFRKSAMLQLKNSGKVSGLLLWKNSTIASFSADDTCPNRASGLPSEACDATDAWNPVGSGMLHIDWGFPIVFVQNLTSIDLLRDCFMRHNVDGMGQQEGPLCAVEVQSHMLAAVDTQTCRRRSLSLKTFTPIKYCDPLGDYSVYVKGQRAGGGAGRGRSVVLVLARMDGASMFDGLTPGAMSPITNVVTVLTTSAYLNYTGAFTKPSNMTLMVVLMNGEAFDYIGSSRVVYDMQRGVFPTAEEPIHLADIGLILELDQISGRDFFYHTHSNDSIVLNFVESLKNNLGPLSVTLSASPGKVPPASVQRFLLADPAIPYLVISNYNSSYNNQYYNSILDTASALGYTYGNNSNTSLIQKEIDTLSSALAKSVYQVLHSHPPTDVAPSKLDLVDELLHCYLETMNCSLWFDVTNGTSLADSAAPTYVGVHLNNNTITRLTGLTLAYLTGTLLPQDMAGCANLSTPGVEYIWMTDKCVESSVNYYLAWSPAFEIDGYNWTSNEYSSWTESVWRELSMRMYLKPSLKQEVLNIAVGLMVLVISFAVVYFINRRSDILFNRVV